MKAAAAMMRRTPQPAGRTARTTRPGCGRRRSSFYCVLDEAGDVLLEREGEHVAKGDSKRFFGRMPGSRIALETGTHSPSGEAVL